MEIYTLQRFYYEVKALIEQCQPLADKLEIEDANIEVQFSIEEIDNRLPKICCGIYARNKKHSSIIFIHEMSPVEALAKLKELILKENGSMIEERIGIEMNMEEQK
jgi:hypothetical protein